MLIFLDESIITLGEEPSQDIVDSLEDIAAIVRAGTHLVTGNIATLRYLLGLEFLGISARMAFKGLASKYAQFASAKQLVTTYAEITASGGGACVIRRGNVSVISIPLFQVKNMSLRSPTEVIYEEIQDDFIYEIISRWYLRANVSPGLLNRNYRAVHGGGGRTFAVYSAAQNRNDQFCLCITDSDKKFPTDLPGPTSAQVKATHRISQALSHHLDLDFHEVENLVPLSFLKRECTSPLAQAITDKIKGVDAAGFPEAKLYWDYKKGLSLAKLKQLNGGWEYWRAAFELGEHVCTAACTLQSCKCEILKPWPEKRVVKEHINSFAEMDPTECNVLTELWSAIGGALISWSISAVPKST